MTDSTASGLNADSDASLAAALTKAQPSFKERAEPAFDGVAVIYDLSDFTSFFTKTEAHRYVPRFLNRITEAISLCINGGKHYWTESEDLTLGGDGNMASLDPSALDLAHRKFLGDGELLLFRLGESPDFELTVLINRFWLLQSRFGNVLKEAQKHIPVTEMPPAIKFGLAQGDIYELKSASGKEPSEFIGVAINLASRLVKYCPGLSFIASARISLDQSILDNENYLRVAAPKLRGFATDIVIVDKDDYDALPKEHREDRFHDL